MTHDFTPSTTDTSPDLLVKSAENTRVSPKSPISLDFFGTDPTDKQRLFLTFYEPSRKLPFASSRR